MQTSTGKALPGLFLCLAAVSGALAEHHSERLSEGHFFDELPLVLSASRLAQPMADAPVAIEVIDRETIAASGALDVPQLLRLVPGFQAADIDGTESVATYHGFSGEFPRRMQVMVDGRSIYDPGLNGVFWASLPITLDQIERIEVVRGANAAAYGSNAVLGSVNIVTRHSADDPGLRFTLLGGSNATRRAGAQYGGRAGDWSYRVAASWRDTDGYDRRRDSSEAELVTLRADHHPPGPDSISLQLGFRNTDFESELFQIPRDRQYVSHYQHLVWNRTLEPGSDLRLQLYHNYFQANDAHPPLLDFSLRTHRYDAELQHVWVPSEVLRVSWGGGYRVDTAQAPGLFDSAESIDRKQLRGFTNLEWHLSPQLLVNSGLMVERFDDNGTFYSPRLALRWKPAPRHSLRMGATRGYRIPTVFEQRSEVKFAADTFVQLLPDPGGLDAERITSYEIGYLREVPAWRGHFDVRLYHDTLRDVMLDVENVALLSTLSDPRVIPSATRVFSNVGEVTVRGVELQSDIRPARDTRLQVAYAYSDSPSRYLQNIDPLAIRAADLAIPTHTVNLMLTQDLPRDWQFSAQWHYVSDMTWLSEGDRIPAHRRTDLRLSKRLRLPRTDLRLSLLAHNVFNQPYWEFQQPRQSPSLFGNRFGRRLYAEIVVQPR